ncbi:lysosomal alpha-mannosidase-like isoform X2 [Cydia pomonella]|uniref:lysosomal alpha-mannosidase-like isoform X2 n=1 Tax=Cydia pomonella TaxID=82600 RepID=UPI002ADE4D19|nr:lysosomal alpha-mannosidase-like isoform X2 [Cydia pomonella]
MNATHDRQPACFPPGVPTLHLHLQQCPQTREGALNVHLIAHSHMDAGWVKTYDQYYYGSKPTISTANVQLIFHSVLSELLHDKRRKFTFSEVSYFWRWWKEQRPATRATFRGLVQEGRVEFAGGGWVQGDEATTDYLMILDQFTWGLRKMNDTLGPCGKPKAAWQIDTYGHTREHASLLAQMGYDGLFIGRVNHKDRESMLEEERMEFMWRGSDVLGKMSDIMTHTLYNLYNAPDGFCFDFLCNEEPIVDDPDSKAYNAEKRVNDFIAQIEHQAKYYEHDNIMVTMGGDFTYQSAANWFMSMDKLINHVNTHPANMSDINIFYSSPSCYLKALYLNGRRDKAIYAEKGDHLPYGSDSSTYWTGFYTSRPSIKYLTRKTHIFLQIAKQLTVLARMGDSYELHLLRHALGLMMHHDAITGTSQQHVANDFVKMLSEAFVACTKKVSTLLSYLTPTWSSTRRSKSNQQFNTCHQINMSQCPFVEGQESLLLLVYNPQSLKTYHYVRLPAIALHYVVRNAYDEELEYQLSPLAPAVTNLPGRSATTNHELVFEAENIPPLGFSSFYITAIKDPLGDLDYMKNKKLGPDPELFTQISNEYLKVTVNKQTGLLESIQHVSGARIEVSQNFHYYGQTRGSLQSGAYSFRPDQRPTPIAEKATYNTIRGALVKEIHQRFSSWASQTLRLYRGEEYLELDWVIGPVPISTDLGKEVVSIFTSNISNHGEFYTDSNMRQMMKRTCWNESAGQGVKKPVASCYYPVTSRLCIQGFNATAGMCILTDRTEGGTSYNEGEIELMVHRRLLTDDGFGLDETLNEEEHGSGLVVHGQHRLFLGKYNQDGEEISFQEKANRVAHSWQWEPWVFAAAADKLNRRKWQGMRNKRFSALRVHGLPRHVRILTLEPWKAGSVLLRLENTLEKNDRTTQRLELPDDMPLPTHINVELRTVFQHLKIKSVRETTLGANQWLEEARQMDWSTRYVYTGGDDGILSEDVDYVEDVKSAHKDSEVDPEQDSSYSVKRNERRRKHKRTTRYENRRKRAINISENFVDNEFAADSEAKEITTEGDELTDESNFNDSIFAINVTDVEETNELTTEANFEEIDVSINKTDDFKKYFVFGDNSGLTTEKLFVKRRKFLSELKTDSFEEDVSSIRSSQKDIQKPAERIDINPDETDDGVTKSMYEMYYKKKTVIKLKKNFKKAVKPRPSWQKRSKKYSEDKEPTEPKEDEIKLSEPYGLRTYESGEEKQSGDEVEDLNMDPGRMRTRRLREAGRRKRATGRTAVPREDPDFLVTLRPTQIRTFVIRFETSKNNYVI